MSAAAGVGFNALNSLVLEKKKCSMNMMNTLVARAIPLMPRAVVEKFSRRYIAGDTLAQAVLRIQQLNAQGFSVTVDVLGEVVSNWQQVTCMANEYTDVLQAISSEQLNASVSVKPSALGLLLDAAACEQTLERLLTVALVHGSGVCLDMEDASCTQQQLDLFDRLKPHHAHLELALQAYLRRSGRDLERLMLSKGPLRICKGIYVEDTAILVEGAAKSRLAINAPFLQLVQRCFETGTFVGIATHDAALIAQVRTLAARSGVERCRFEFQMLLGVCEPLRNSLRDEGFAVRIYVPYGKDWYGYSCRRMKENPSIAGHVLRSFLRV